MVIRVLVHWLDGRTFHFDLCDITGEFQRFTVLQLKQKIIDLTGYPEDQFRLIFETTQLEDDRLLSEYGIGHLSLIHSVLKLRGGGSISGDDGMGDKEGNNRSMEKLAGF